MARIIDINIGDVVNVENTHLEVVEADNAPHTHGITLRMVDVCAACGKVGVDYTTAGGVNLCAGCVERVFTYRVVMQVLEDIRAYDPTLHDAIVALDNDDAAMRTSSRVPYITSTDTAWDTLRGETRAEVEGRVYGLVQVCVDATREPGTVRT